MLYIVLQTNQQGMANEGNDDVSPRLRFLYVVLFPIFITTNNTGI